MPKEKSSNSALAACFTELAQLEALAGGRWQVSAYKKVAKALESHPSKIKSGKQAEKLEGVGKASSAKIQEYLDTGCISKLEELREEYGDCGVKKVSKKDMKGKPVSKSDRKKIKEAISEAMSLAANAMKDELRQNQQRTTGNKPALAQLIAEGRVLGAVPKCELCGIGILKFDMDSGLYSCPGGFDDTVYQPCGFLSGKVKRDTWKCVNEEEDSSSSDSDEDSDES